MLKEVGGRTVDDLEMLRESPKWVMHRCTRRHRPGKQNNCSILCWPGNIVWAFQINLQGPELGSAPGYEVGKLTATNLNMLLKAWLANPLGLVVMKIVWKEQPVIAAGVTENTTASIAIVRPKEHSKLACALSAETRLLWILQNRSLYNGRIRSQ